MKLRRFHITVTLISLGLCLVLGILALSIGPQESILEHFFSGTLSHESAFVLFQLRFPRLLLAFAAGSLLSLAGLSYQSIFSNPIASPYTLGVSGGAAVGFVLGELLFIELVPFSYSWVFSTVGGALVLFLLLPLLLMRTRDYLQTVLLVGVLISLFSGSMLYFLQYFLDPSGLVELTSWYFGSLSIVGYTSPLILLVLSFALFYVLSLSASALDLILFGREYAASHGVDVKKVQAGIIGLTTLSISLVVSVSGPIGFVGLIVPHFSRSLVGNAHEKLVPVTFFAGGLFLLLSDVVSRMVGGSQEIPVGLVTALIGCPVMIALLIRQPSMKVSA